MASSEGGSRLETSAPTQSPTLPLGENGETNLEGTAAPGEVLLSPDGRCDGSAALGR